MNNDLAQFTEERLNNIIELADNPTMAALARIALAAKQAKPVGFVGKSYAMTYFMPPQDSGVEIDDLIYTTPPANSPAIPDGWKLVPEEATLAMLTLLGMTGSFEFMQQKYKNMLAAAPKPESE